MRETPALFVPRSRVSALGRSCPWGGSPAPSRREPASSQGQRSRPLRGGVAHQEIEEGQDHAARLRTVGTAYDRGGATRTAARSTLSAQAAGANFLVTGPIE